MTYPKIVHDPGYEKKLRQKEKIEARLIKIREELDTLKKNTYIVCRCGASSPISTQTYIQTHWYVEPHGCTGGDYWNEGEGRWDCPKCGHKNRISTTKSYGNDPLYHPEIAELTRYFADIRDCYCKDRLFDFRPCNNCEKELRKAAKK